MGCNLQAAPLDLSGVDLGKTSGQRLKQDHKWTLVLIIKLSLPLLLSVVRTLCVCVGGGGGQ